MQSVYSWADFEKEAQNKSVLLYGTGAGIVDFCVKYEDRFPIAGVVYGSPDKQGCLLGDLSAGLYQTWLGELRVEAPDFLDVCFAADTVVLIASLNRADEIIDVLESKGYDKYFVISKFKDYRVEDIDFQTIITAGKSYAKQCIELPIEKKKIIFHSYQDYADHEKYISEALTGIRTDLDVVWLIGFPGAYLPDHVRGVLKGNWKKVIHEMETAAIWVSDLDLPEYLIKREGQTYIQTKHWASLTLKRFYFDTATFQKEPQLLSIWEREKKIIDYIVVGSEFDRESCRRGFQVDSFIMAGSPRTDAMFCEEKNKKRVYSHYHIDQGLHMLLYAPTYRFDKERGKSYEAPGDIGFAYAEVRAALEKRFGGKWVIALRLHPAVANALEGAELPEFVMDMSHYDDSEELVSAANITVSDFSSIMFEPAFVKKPVFLFAKDKESYIQNEYDLLIEYETLPFAIAQTSEQLCDNILSYDEEAYRKRVDEFLEQYGVHEDGRASERVAGFIAELIGEEKEENGNQGY